MTESGETTDATHLEQVVWANLPVGLVLLDEDARVIRPDVPIIISTAYDPSPPAERLDLTTFLPKPYHYHDLERSLQQAIHIPN